MSYTTEKISSNQVKLSFSIPAEDFEAAVQKAYLKTRGRIRVPGFRPGKAPRKFIENMYGKQVFYDDALNDLIPDVYDAAIEEAGIQAVDQPNIHVDQAEEGKEVLFTAEVYVYPEVTLGQYEKLEVEIEPETVNDAAVDARIEQVRAEHSRTEEVLDRPVENGDTVKLDYAGTVDGVAFDGGTAEDQTLTIGSNSFIPGFEEQIVGMCVAEEKDLHVTFPEQYHAKELAGKDAVFHVKVNSISKTELPELDDEFAADVSDYSTFAEYRESVRKELEEQAQKNNRVAAENAVVEKAVENAEVDIPKAMEDRQLAALIREQDMQMRYQGYTLDDFLKYLGQTREQFAENYRGEARRRLKVQLVIEAVQKAAGIEADEEAIEKQTAEQAERLGRELADFKSSLTDSQKEALKDAAAVQKTVDLMMASAKVTEKQPEPETPADPETAEGTVD